jgi:peroxiredoxin
MRMRQIASLAILTFGFSALVAAAPVPRPSPDLVIVEPSGKEIPLSSLKGDVVVIEFLLVGCARCQRIAQTLSTLNSELGPRGFHPIGIAFDVGINGLALNSFAQRFKVNYPVGYTTSDKVDSYLGRAITERFQVPQIVVIDRAGVIRAQSRPVGEANLEDEAYLRNLLDALLKEAAPAGKAGETISAPTNG